MGDGRESVRRNQGQVVQGKRGIRFCCRQHLPCGRLRGRGSRVPSAGGQGGGKCEGLATFVWGEVAVSAGESQTVRLPDDRCAGDLHWGVEVEHHSTDARKLLSILLAEDRDVRSDKIE